MLPTSVRRVVQTAPQTGFAASIASTAPKAAAPFLGRGHQRRYSSSKPSNGSNKDITAEPSTPAPSRGRKRKTKEVSDLEQWTKNLPTVPTTTHMTKGALSLTSFFSLHRPISITEPMPKSMTSEHFASIFTPPTKSKKVQDTMSTLSSTIDQLEGPVAHLTVEAQESDMPGETMHTMEYRNPDGTETNIQLKVDAMAGDFFPFRPPPAPQPQAGDSEVSAMHSELLEDQPAHRVYKAVFTIEETTEADGQVRILAHSPRIVDVPPRSFLERLAQRQVKFDEAQGNRGTMHAISVRRQRKLRMKKKKYKKLMRRTRNLRRKLDRT